MSYDRQIQVFLSDGVTLDTSRYLMGLVTDCVDASFSLGARGGVLNGKIVLPGTFRDAFKFESGQVIAFKYDSSTTVYIGTVGPRRRSVDGLYHDYDLLGYWSRLSQVVINKRILFGSGILANEAGLTTGERHVTGKNSPEAILKWIIDTDDSDITGIEAATGIGYDAPDIEATGVTISEFIIEPGQDIYQIIEQLELLACSAGVYYTAGINLSGSFYFSAISTLVGDLQSTYTVGVDAIAGEEEELARYKLSNRARVIGAWLTRDANAGFLSNKIFEDSGSIAAWGPTPQRKLRVPALRKQADMQKFANGYFFKYADPEFNYSGLRRIHQDGDAILSPWAGQILLTDTQRGDLRQDYFTQADYDFNEQFSYTIQIGKQERGLDGGSGTSIYAPSETGDYFDDVIGGGDDGFGDTLIDTFPEVTDLTEPFDDALHMSGPGVPLDGSDLDDYIGGTGGGSGSGLERGQVVELLYPGGLRYLASGEGGRARFQVVVSNGGTALPSGAVTIYYRFYDPDDALVASSSMVLELDRTEGNSEFWKTSDAGGYQPPSGGTLYFAAKIITDDDPVEVSNWHPADFSSASNRLQCPKIEVIDVTGGNTITGLSTVFVSGSTDEV